MCRLNKILTGNRSGLRQGRVGKQRKRWPHNVETSLESDGKRMAAKDDGKLSLKRPRSYNRNNIMY